MTDAVVYGVLPLMLDFVVGFGGAYLGCFVGAALIRRDLGLDAAPVDASSGGDA